MPKKKKLSHIQVKDNGVKLSQKLGDELSFIQNVLTAKIIDNLLKGSSSNDLRMWQITQNNLLRGFKSEAHKLITDTAKTKKETLKNDYNVNLNKKQQASISNSIDKGLLFLEKDAYRQFQSTIQQTVATMRSNKSIELKDALTKHIKSGIDLGVVYQDGKHFQFDTYYEMKARTDIQNEIKENMISAGQNAGVIFYLCAYFGDCAKDHADYQGKIYYDKDWRSNAPKDRVEEIQNYIDSNKLMSVQEVTGAPVYLTSRPNCRHYFQYIDIDSVLGAKTEKQVSDLREERDLNFNGKYKPEKYKALQQQRLNERNIRKEKVEIDIQEKLLALNPGDKEIQKKIVFHESKVRQYQKEQRDLIKKYSNLERDYERESTRLRASFGVQK